jgi:hypothetical protein
MNAGEICNREAVIAYRDTSLAESVAQEPKRKY